MQLQIWYNAMLAKSLNTVRKKPLKFMTPKYNIKVGSKEQ